MKENIYTVCLPDIGEGVVEGEVIKWLKEVGETVFQDEPVVVVMTDKATVELPAPYPGIIQKHYHEPGEIAIKDKPLYDIFLTKDVQPEGLVSPVEEEVHSETQFREALKLKEPLLNVKSVKTREKTKAIPKVRYEAKEWNVDLNQITGTGNEGRITESDLRHAIVNSDFSSPLEVRESDEIKPLNGIRGMMAKKMDEIHIPQFSYFEQVEATRLIQLKEKIKDKAQEEGIHLSYMPFFIRALSLTMKRFPQMNASVDMQQGRVLYHTEHHIGIAMAKEEGLIVPVLKGVESMSLETLIKAFEHLKAQVLAGKLVASDMKGATITLSNFGVLGGEGIWATPMISNPEVAILAIAKIRKLPIVKGKELVIRDIAPLSWSFDHRLIDGHLAAQISSHYSLLLNNPAYLL